MHVHRNSARFSIATVLLTVALTLPCLTVSPVRSCRRANATEVFRSVDYARHQAKPRRAPVRVE